MRLANLYSMKRNLQNKARTTHFFSLSQGTRPHSLPQAHIISPTFPPGIPPPAIMRVALHRYKYIVCVYMCVREKVKNQFDCILNVAFRQCIYVNIIHSIDHRLTFAEMQGLTLLK